MRLGFVLYRVCLESTSESYVWIHKMCSLVQLRAVKAKSFGGCDCIFMCFFGADSSCLLLPVKIIDFIFSYSVNL